MLEKKKGNNPKGVSKSIVTEGITPLITSLSGIAKLPKDFDYRNEYADFLTKKYS